MSRKIEKDVVMRTWKMEVGGHGKIGRPKLRWSDVTYKKRHEGETSKDRRSTRPDNIEIDNSLNACCCPHSYIYITVSSTGEKVHDRP